MLRTTAIVWLPWLFISPWAAPVNADEKMIEVAIGGAPGKLPGADVVEIWDKGEIVIAFPHSNGAERLLLKGANTSLVADGYCIASDRAWKVTGKRIYQTVGGVERCILVAEPMGPGCEQSLSGGGSPEAFVAVGDDGRLDGHITQILNGKEMLVTMRVGMIRWSGPLSMGAGIVLLRGIDTTTLTEDSPLSVGRYPINGTYRYNSPDGSSHTVFVSDAGKARAEQAAKQKILNEEKRKRQEEDRAHEHERRLAAEKERKAAEDARWHTWRAADGVHTAEAKFVSADPNNICLEKRDGTKIKIAKEKISKEDLEWIRRRGWRTPPPINQPPLR